MQIVHLYQHGLALLFLVGTSGFQAPTVNRFTLPIARSGLRQPNSSLLKKNDHSPQSCSMKVRQNQVCLEAWRDPVFEPLQRVGKFKVQKIIRRLVKWFRMVKTSLALFLIFCFATLPSLAGATSAGRMGGSFFEQSSSSSHSSRTSLRSPVRSSPGTNLHRTYRRPTVPSRLITPIRIYQAPSPQVVIHTRGSTIWSTPYEVPAKRFSFSDAVLLTGTGALLAYGFRSNYFRGRDQQNSGPLGPGFSVASLTVSLDVPNRDDPNSILSKLRRQALSVQTDSTKGIQSMLSQATLELLRQEKSIVSVDSSYSHFLTVKEAERKFNKISIEKRSKFDRETGTSVWTPVTYVSPQKFSLICPNNLSPFVVNIFGGENHADKSANRNGSYAATAAVITITIAITGDSTRFDKIKSRSKLREALFRIASDCQVDDSLLAAEILWSPEERSDVLTTEDIYADYPNLYPLME